MHFFPFRLIGVALTNLTDESFEQLSLFEDNEKKERNRKLDATMDAIRQKFGNDKITRASIMNRIRESHEKHEHR